MKKLIVIFSFLLFNVCHASGLSGLTYTTYIGGGPQPSLTFNADGTLARTLLNSGTTSTVNYNWGSGAIFNSGYYDGVIVRFRGYVNIATAGTYYFGGNADDGLIIKVNNTTVLNSWYEDGGSFRYGSINLAAGVYPIDVFYYENGGGALVNLQWYTGSSWQIVPSSSLSTDSTYWAPAYVSSITPTQQAHYNSMVSRRNAITENSIYIDQVGSNNTVSNTQDGRYNKIAGVGSTAAPIQGDYNTVTTKQGNVSNPLGKNLIEFNIYGSYNNLNLNQGQSATDTGGHMQSVYVGGNNNSVTTDQTNNNGNYGHYLETNITGNNNTQNLTQAGNAVKKMFVNTAGSGNSVSALQDGLGSHYLNVNLTGTGNDAQVTQTGNTANAATLNLTNAGAPASVTLNQSGGQTYNIDRTCTTTCARVTVTQP